MRSEQQGTRIALQCCVSVTISATARGKPTKVSTQYHIDRASTPGFACALVDLFLILLAIRRDRYRALLLVLAVVAAVKA